MARITVEDCVARIDNRFKLVLVATTRARQLVRGQAPRVDEDDDKPTVIALREIAEGLVGESILDEAPVETIEDQEAGAARFLGVPRPRLGDDRMG